MAQHIKVEVHKPHILVEVDEPRTYIRIKIDDHEPLEIHPTTLTVTYTIDAETEEMFKLREVTQEEMDTIQILARLEAAGFKYVGKEGDEE